MAHPPRLLPVHSARTNVDHGGLVDEQLAWVGSNVGSSP